MNAASRRGCRLGMFGLLLMLTAAHAQELSPVRQTPAGPVRGLALAGGGYAWLGLPYAQSPVGALRWRAPRPLAAWNEPRAATEFAPPCSQASIGGGTAARLIGAEDCLYLNIWTPRAALAPVTTQPLPVMVWLHGGANRFGSGNIDPRLLVLNQQVIVVSFNYRLGVFGWFRHPHLSGAALADKGTADDRSGNYGTLDQIAALQWIRRNIAAFGGDPTNITLFGESAGGSNVLALLTSRAAGTLFHKAIAQSGNAERGFTVAQAENASDAAEPGAPLSAQEVVLQLLIDNGTARDRQQAVRRYRALSAATVARLLRDSTFAQLSRALDSLQKQHYRAAGVVLYPQLFRDGHVLPELATSAALAVPNATRDMPILLGTTRDEARLFIAYNRHFATPKLTASAQDRTYAVAIADKSRFDTAAYYESRLWKWSGVDLPTRALNAWRTRGVFVYRFDWDRAPPMAWLDGQRLGAAHGLDVPFVFGTLDAPGSVLLAGAFAADNIEPARQLSDAMMSYWAEFARNGDPGRGRDGSLPQWRAWVPRIPAKAQAEAQAATAAEELNVLLLDEPRGGGIRMAADYVSKAQILAELARDPRAGATAAQRCHFLWQLIDGAFVSFTHDDYAALYRGADDRNACADPLPGNAIWH